MVFSKVWPYLEIGGLDKDVGRPAMEEEHLGTAGPRVSPRNSYRVRFQQKKPGPWQQPAEGTKPVVSRSLECPALLRPPSWEKIEQLTPSLGSCWLLAFPVSLRPRKAITDKSLRLGSRTRP